MAHIFDYSKSRLGLFGTSAQDDLMFGHFNSGTAKPADYWGSDGALYTPVSWNEQDTSVYPPKEYLVSAQLKLDSLGSLLVVREGEDALSEVSLEAQADAAPADYLTQSGRLVLSNIYDGYSYGSYMAISGLAAPVRSLVPHSPYASYNIMSESVYALADATNAAFRADLLTLAQTSLGHAGPITVRAWDSDPVRADDFVLTYAPDAKTKLELGDLLDFGNLDTPHDNGSIKPHAEMFRGEDVRMILTKETDLIVLNTLPARSLNIQMGGGDDMLTFGNDIAETGKRDHLPLALSVDGGTGDDMISVFPALQTTLSGGDGADDLSLSGGALPAGSNAVLLGGAGDDRLESYGTASKMDGGAGNDSANGGIGVDTVLGGTGDDFLRDFDISTESLSRYFGASNLQYGGDGLDTLWGGAGDDTQFGGTGADTLWGGLGDDLLVGGKGIDVFDWGTVVDGFNVALGDDVLIDKGGLIAFSDFSPFDRIKADKMIRVGADLILGDAGVSSLRLVGFYDKPKAWFGATDMGLGAVKDRGVIDFAAARGLDQTARLGSAKDDTIRLAGTGVAAGKAGDDHIIGSARKDILFGDTGDDHLEGRGGRDRLLGGEGQDKIYGGGSADILAGNQGNDRLYGASGTDALFGGNGDDLLSGGAGADHLSGGAGNDKLIGGGGSDFFEFTMGFEEDHIMDFTAGDTIVISRQMFADLRNPSAVTPATVVQLLGTVVDGSLVLDFGYGDLIVIEGITNRALVAAAVQIDDF